MFRLKTIFLLFTALIGALLALNLSPSLISSVSAFNLTQPANSGVRADGNIGFVVSTIINNLLTIIFIVAALAVLFMLVWGAFEWITSGGDKEALSKARKRISTSLIGLVFLALALLIVNLVGQMVNINILGPFQIPTLGSSVQQPPARIQPQPIQPRR